jgi:hypothetical protein
MQSASMNWIDPDFSYEATSGDKAKVPPFAHIAGMAVVGGMVLIELLEIALSFTAMFKHGFVLMHILTQLFFAMGIITVNILLKVWPRNRSSNGEKILSIPSSSRF